MTQIPSSIAQRSTLLHKQHVDLRGTFAEAVEFCDKHSEIVRLIL